MIEYYKNKSLESLFYVNENGLVCQEEWLDILNYEGIYKISNLGRRKNKKGQIQKARIKKNYNTARLFKDKIYTEYSVHRLVASAFIPNPENKPCVNHKNGIKSDNRASNLEWCTISENSIHAVANGLQKIIKGSDCSWSKLCEKQVLEIRELYSLGFLFQRQIAKIYNIKPPTVSDIVRRKRWAHL